MSTRYRIVKLKNGKYTTQFQYKKCKDIWFFADSCDINRLIPIEYDTSEEAKAQQLNNFISEVVEEFTI